MYIHHVKIKFDEKEVFCLVAIIFFILTVVMLTFGIEGFQKETLTSLNIQDTYFTIATVHIVILFSALFFFSIYLIRMFRNHFKNLIANLIFIISDGALISIITYMILLISPARIQTDGSPENLWDTAYYILLGFEFILVILLLLSIFNTVKFFRKRTRI